MDNGLLSGHLDPAAERFVPGGIEDLLTAVPETLLRSVPGRETFLWPGGEPSALVVKRHARDEDRDRWYDRLHGHSGRSPGKREYDNLAALVADGMPVPRPLGWAETRDGRSLVVMERVPHHETLHELARRGSAADQGPLRAQLLELVVRLHQLGWYHRDLYLAHWAVGAGERLVLLDVGRARRELRPRRRWFVKDLAALLHSTPKSVPLAGRLRFLAAYLDARGVRGRRLRRRWARAVGARARRIAAHAPRYDAPDAPEAPA